MNWCGGLIDGCGAPLLRAHGAAMGASIVLVVRHDRHQLAPFTSLSTGPCRSGASSKTVSSSVLAVHLKSEGQEVRLLHLPLLPHSIAVSLFVPDTEQQH